MRDRSFLVARVRLHQRVDCLPPLWLVPKVDVLQDEGNAVAHPHEMLAFVRSERALPDRFLSRLLDNAESGPLELHGPDLLLNRLHSGSGSPPSRVPVFGRAFTWRAGNERCRDAARDLARWSDFEPACLHLPAMGIEVALDSVLRRRLAEQVLQDLSLVREAQCVVYLRWQVYVTGRSAGKQVAQIGVVLALGADIFRPAIREHVTGMGRTDNHDRASL